MFIYCLLMFCVVYCVFIFYVVLFLLLFLPDAPQPFLFCLRADPASYQSEIHSKATLESLKDRTDARPRENRASWRVSPEIRPIHHAKSPRAAAPHRRDPHTSPPTRNPAPRAAAAVGVRAAACADSMQGRDRR